MSFIGGDKHFVTLYTGVVEGVTDEPVAKIYIQLDDRPVIFLPDITEEDMEAISEMWVQSGRDEVVPTERFDGVRTYSFDSNNRFNFVSGRLVFCTLDKSQGDFSGFKSIKVARSKNGPFLEFPATRDELVRVLGKPKKFGSGIQHAP